jgi:hypothetical protein
MAVLWRMVIRYRVLGVDLAMGCAGIAGGGKYIMKEHIFDSNIQYAVIQTQNASIRESVGYNARCNCSRALSLVYTIGTRPKPFSLVEQLMSAKT